MGDACGKARDPQLAGFAYLGKAVGFSSGTLWHYRWLGRAGKIPRRARVLELGSQNAWGDFELSHLRDFMTVFGASVPDERLLSSVAPGSKVEQLMRDAGFLYTAFDVYSSGGTRAFDLNVHSVGWRERGRYDVVTNCGTSEHVANQFNAFKVAHDALKVGGVMLNFVPFYGQIDHGLINYHPKFFTTLIANNGYELLYFGLSDVFSGGDIDRYRLLSKANNGTSWEGREVGCAEMCVIWQKAKRRSFRPPSDISDITGEYISVNQLLARVPDFSAYQQ
jgi:hypothetical protein